MSESVGMAECMVEHNINKDFDLVREMLCIIERLKLTDNFRGPAKLRGKILT